MECDVKAVFARELADLPGAHIEIILCTTTKERADFAKTYSKYNTGEHLVFAIYIISWKLTADFKNAPHDDHVCLEPEGRKLEQLRVARYNIARHIGKR